MKNKRFFLYWPEAVIAAISLAVYLNALLNGFVYDDIDQIVNNAWIRDVRRIPELFNRGVWGFRDGISTGNYYRPLMHLAFMADYHAFGLNPLGYHLVNMIFNAGVSVLVYLLAKRLWAGRGPGFSSTFTSIPFIAAVLFAVHPIHTEAVTWVSAFPEVSFTFFYLLSFLLYIRAVEGKAKAAYALSVASFFVSSLCKETALTLPLIILCYEHFFRKAGERPVWYLKRYAPFFLAGVVYFALRFHALGGFAPAEHNAGLTGYECFINVFPLFGMYLLKLAFPVNLNAYHVFHPISSLFGTKGLVSLSLALIFACLALAALKKGRNIFFALLLIVVPLLPVLYIRVVGGTSFSERYLYLPSAGFAMIAAYYIALLASKPVRSTAAGMVFVSVAGLYSAGTISRNAVWRNEYALWTDTAHKSPDSPVPHNCLGNVYQKAGMEEKAVEEFREALSIDPGSANAHNNMGNVYLEKGMLEQAVVEYSNAVNIMPYSARFHYNLGNAYLKKGMLEQAVVEDREALKMNPDFMEAHGNLGNAYLGKGMLDQAVEEYREALKINSSSADIHYNLGNAYLEKGMLEQAVEEYKAAIKIDPGSVDAHYNLGFAYFKEGLPEQAVEEYRVVLTLKPALAPEVLPRIQAASRK